LLPPPPSCSRRTTRLGFLYHPTLTVISLLPKGEFFFCAQDKTNLPNKIYRRFLLRDHLPPPLPPLVDSYFSLAFFPPLLIFRPPFDIQVGSPPNLPTRDQVPRVPTQKLGFFFSPTFGFLHSAPCSSPSLVVSFLFPAIDPPL